MNPESGSVAPDDAARSEPRPKIVPRPTYWPAAMALGITFLLWGLITSPVLLAAGATAFIIALAGWIGEIRHEREE